MKEKNITLPNWSVFYHELRERIITGSISTETPINLVELKQELKITLSSSEESQVIDFLMAEGLLKLNENQVTINPLPARSKRDVGFVEDYLAEGRQPSIKTLVLEILPVNQVRAEARQYFSDDAGELLIRHYHVQLVDKIPYAIADSYIPEKHFAKFFTSLKNAPFDLFNEMSKLGFLVTRKQEKLHVDFPTRIERDLLNIIELTRVQIVRLESVVWSGSTLVEVCFLCDRADLYEFHYNISVNM